MFSSMTSTLVIACSLVSAHATDDGSVCSSRTSTSGECIGSDSMVQVQHRPHKAEAAPAPAPAAEVTTTPEATTAAATPTTMLPLESLKVSEGQVFDGESWRHVSPKGDAFWQNMVKPMLQHSSNFEVEASAADYIKDDKGMKFFSLWRQAHVNPPGLSNFETFFETDSNLVRSKAESFLSFKQDTSGNDWNLLRIQAESMKGLREDTLKLGSWDLTSKNVVITGMSSGIGFVLAVRLAELGANVYGCARTRNFFAYSKETALTDGVEHLREDRRYSGTAEEVAAALGTDEATVTASTFLKLEEQNDQGEQLYKMPQDFHPLYTGPFGVSSDTFDRITFDEVDVRSHEQLNNYVKKLHDTYQVSQIDYLMINAQTETSFVPLHNHEDTLDDVLQQSPLTTADLLSKYPDRTAGDRGTGTGIVREYQVGCKYLIAKIVQTYGYANIVNNTDIILTSSIAGAMSSYHGFEALSSLMGEYMNVKTDMTGWAKQMRTTAGQPLRINVVYPGVFMCNINFGWVCDIANLMAGRSVCQHPRQIVRTDWQSGAPDASGKFFAPYTTTGAQAFQDAALGMQTPALTPGAEYAALQFMAMMRKNKALSGEQRMDVVVEGSPAQGSAHIVNMGFGVAAAEVAKHSLYQDFADETTNPTYQMMVLGVANPLDTEKTMRAARSWLLHAIKNDVQDVQDERFHDVQDVPVQP